MAPPRARVVVAGPAPEPGGPSSSSPCPLVSEARLAPGTVARGVLSPRAHSPDSDYHYESPNEDNQPAFFSQHQQQGSEHEPSQPSRPVLLSRPSHMVSFAPPSPPQTNGSGLDDIMSKAEKLTPGRKVGIKDRIACYQWTYFTMVSPHSLVEEKDCELTSQTMATGGVANVLYSCICNPIHISFIGN